MESLGSGGAVAGRALLLLSAAPTTPTPTSSSASTWSAVVADAAAEQTIARMICDASAGDPARARAGGSPRRARERMHRHRGASG